MSRKRLRYKGSWKMWKYRRVGRLEDVEGWDMKCVCSGNLRWRRERVRAEDVCERRLWTGFDKKESGHWRTYDVVELRGSLPVRPSTLQTVLCSGSLCCEAVVTVESVEVGPHTACRPQSGPEAGYDADDQVRWLNTEISVVKKYDYDGPSMWELDGWMEDEKTRRREDKVERKQR